MFFSAVATAQSLEELVSMQTELQNIVTMGNVRLNDANATANMSAQEIADFQAEINAAQNKLLVIAPMLDELYARALRDREEQIAADALAVQQATEASQASGKSTVEAQYQAAADAEQAAINARQADYDAEQLLITQKQAVIANPSRYAPAPDPNNPTWVPFRVSTGDPQQDAQIVRDWLIEHGIIR